MKKSIITLVLVFLVSGALFAATGDKLILLTKVGEVKPKFEIYGNTSVQGTQSGATIDWRAETGKDPSANDIVLSITLKHVGYNENGNPENFVRFKKDDGVVLTVTATELINQTTGMASIMTGTPKAGTISTPKGTTTDFEVDTSGEGSATVTVTPKYLTGRPVDNSSDNGVIATWDYTWQKKADLSNGDYKATITLTYTEV